MAFLTIPTFGDVPVAMDPSAARREKDHEVGERRRAYDGTMHTSIRGRKRSWNIRTPPLLRATADSLYSALEATPPLACSGDLLGGAVSCHYESGGADHPRKQTGEHQVVEFTLHEQ